MTSRQRALSISIGVGLVLALAVSFGKLAAACRRPESEACVWGRALLPVSLAIGAALGMVSALVIFVVVRTWQKRGGA